MILGKLKQLKKQFLDDEAESQTEGEEFARAREIRMQEVKLMPLPKLPTDTETDVSRLKFFFGNNFYSRYIQDSF